MEYITLNKLPVVDISCNALNTIREQPKKFSEMLKLSTPSINQNRVVLKPEGTKVHFTAEEARHLGDGSFSGVVSSLFWNLGTLLCGPGYVKCGGSRKIADEIMQGQGKSECIEFNGLDETNESTRFNWLYHRSYNEVVELTGLVLEIIRSRSESSGEEPYLMFGRGDSKILLKLNLVGSAAKYLVMADANGIWLKKEDKNQRDFPPIKFMSLHEYHNIVVLNKIKNQLTPKARLALQPYFALEERGDVNELSSIVGTGGGTACMVLLGIHARRIEIDDEGIPYLAHLLNTKVRALMRPELEQTEKEKSQIKTSEETLALHLTHKPHGAPLRLMNDVAVDSIQVAMKKNGTIFIAGNRDNLMVVAKPPTNNDGHKSKLNLSYEEDITLDEDQPPVSRACMSDVRDDANANYNGRLNQQSNLCNNADYDETTNTLYVSVGVESIEWDEELRTGFIQTAVGRYEIHATSDGHDFAKWMNGQLLPKPDQDDDSSDSQKCEYEHYIKFKPEGQAIADATKILRANIVVVRDDICDYENKHVVILNSPGGENANPIVAARIGKVG